MPFRAALATHETPQSPKEFELFYAPVKKSGPAYAWFRPSDDAQRYRHLEETLARKAFYKKVEAEAKVVDAERKDVAELRNSLLSLKMLHFRVPEVGSEGVLWTIELPQKPESETALVFKEGEKKKWEFKIKGLASPISMLLIPDRNAKLFKAPRIALLGDSNEPVFPKAEIFFSKKALYVTRDAATDRWRIQIGEETADLVPGK